MAEPGNLLELVDVLRDEKRELEAEVARLRDELDKTTDYEADGSYRATNAELAQAKSLINRLRAKLEAKPLDRTRYTQPFRRR